MYLSLSQEPVFFYLIATPMYTVRCKKMWNYPSFSLDFYLLLKIHWYVLFRCFWGSCFWERSSITLSVRLYAGHVLVLVFLQYMNCFLKQVFSSSDSLSLSKIVAETLRFECSMGVFVQIAASQAKTYCKRVLSQLFIQSSNLKHCNL